MIPVTACLITWRRQHNIPEIISNLMKYDFITEIIVRDNSKSENIINYGRYTSAAKAENNIIYTQDDDCVVNNLEKLYNAFILSSAPKIVHTGPKYYEKDIPNNIYGGTQMSLMGWGSFFDRSWAENLNKYIAKYGKDHCFYRETDRIFSILLGTHSIFVPVSLYQFQDATGPMALCNQDEHIEYKNLAIHRALGLYEGTNADN